MRRERWAGWLHARVVVPGGACLQKPLNECPPHLLPLAAHGPAAAHHRHGAHQGAEHHCCRPGRCGRPQGRPVLPGLDRGEAGQGRRRRWRPGHAAGAAPPHLPPLLRPSPTQSPAGQHPPAQGTTAVWWTLNPAGRFGILPTDPSFSIISAFEQATRSLEVDTFTCPANKPLLAPVFPTIPDCPAGCGDEMPAGRGPCGSAQCRLGQGLLPSARCLTCMLPLALPQVRGRQLRRGHQRVRARPGRLRQ